MPSNIKLITPPDTIDDNSDNILLVNVSMHNLGRLINDLWGRGLDLNIYLCNNLDDVWLNTVLPKVSKVLAYDVMDYGIKLYNHSGFAKYRNYEELINELST